MRADPAVPGTMRAAAIDAFGGPEKLVMHEVPVPSVDPHEVLIRVDTAGVGVWDAKARRGLWASGDDRFPMILGADGSGTIASLGNDVRGFALGDAVIGYAYGDAKGGFYAEYVALSAEHAAPMPSSLDFREAGALPVTGLTALAGIDDALNLRPGQTILIHGATGGVGTMAVQFAKRRGARVIATANGGEGRELLRTLGADETVDTTHEDVARAARRIAPDGVDALLAFAGGPDLERAVGAVREGGTIAYPHGVTLPDGANATAFDGVPNPAAFARLTALIDETPVEVPITALYSLDDAAEAHRRLERGHALGKIVLVVDATENVVEKVA
ncbi:MAG TPA: NADP-dependent oxidoreductase [Candidatus Elarobacter sp.]|jgi:NADPH:quinone reductase-like Zn-dependent oxidoreductase